MKNLRNEALQLFAKAEEIYGDVEATDEMVADADAMMAKAESLEARADKLDAAAQKAADLKTAQKSAPLPTSGEGNLPGATDSDAGADDNEAGVAKAVAAIRHGASDDPTSVVMREIFGGDYRELNHQQNKAFDSYLRRGADNPVLRRQMWSATDVNDMLKKGMSVAEVKATMVEGTDILGGYAVPVEVASGIIRRLRGLTAVRAAGATVVTTAGKSIEWLKVTGGDSQYAGAIRGAWGSETQSPAAKNMTFGTLTIPVNVYTYKAPMSVSLLEDATNLTDLFTMEVAEALAMDEDIAFLTGDGANKPYGILPGGLNARSLNSIASLSSSTLTINGLKALRRGIASQYRGQNASLLGTSATGLVIEQLLDGENRHYVEELVAGEYNRVISGTWRENESLPAVGSGTIPLIYGDLSGYAIVERLGLSIQRYNDSNTGINVVEFHIRRRLGGDVIQPWKICVQDVAAS